MWGIYAQRCARYSIEAALHRGKLQWQKRKSKRQNLKRSNSFPDYTPLVGF